VYRFRPESLSASENTPVRLASSADEPAIAACYARTARLSNGLIERTARSWRRHLDAPSTHAYIHTTSGMRGYMLLRYGRGRTAETRPLFIRELVAEDDQVYAELLGWIALQRDLWRVIRYDAAPDEHFDLRLRDPRPPAFRATRWLWQPTARVIRGPMLRIVNVAEAITRRREWGAAQPLSFTLSVTDPVLADNAAPLRVDFDGSVATVESASRHGESGTRLEAEIGTLTQIYAGELTVRTAARLGLAQAAGDVDALDALFRPSSAFRLLDEF
jgi:predicted acetyltransferase